MPRHVVLDTSVLFPPSLRDLLLTLAALGALEVQWSDEILAELVRTVPGRYPDIDPERFRATTVAAMAAAFPDAGVTGWEELVEEMDNEAADRHVAAAAVVAGADAIVTFNTRDFGGAVLAARGVAVVTPGQLVLDLLDDLPDRVVHAVIEMAARKERPPMTTDDVLEALGRHPGFDAALRRLRELLV